MAEWIAEVKKHPGKYTYASAGNGTPHHIFMELLKTQLGLDIVHVPYKGSSSAMTDLLTGRVDMAFLDGTLAIPNIKSGSCSPSDCRLPGAACCCRRSRRSPRPCRASTGAVGSRSPARANMPAPVVKLLADEIRTMQATPQFANLLNAAAMEPTDPSRRRQWQLSCAANTRAGGPRSRLRAPPSNDHTRMNMHPTHQIRRIVTGHDDNGKAIIESDGICPHVRVREGAGFVSSLLWVTDETPARVDLRKDRAARTIGVPPPPNGSILRVVDFPPVTKEAEAIDQETLLKSMGADQHSHGGGRRATPSCIAPGASTTPSSCRARSTCCSTIPRCI